MTTDARIQALEARAANAARGAQAAIDALARAAFARMWQLLTDNPGIAPRDAIERAQLEFGGGFATAVAEAFSELLKRSVGVAEIRAMPVGDVPLSARLYRHSVQTSNEVAALVRQHAQGVHQARELALRLYDGYDPKDGIKRPLESRARADLPKALRAITADPEARTAFQQLIDQGQAQAARLKSAPLRAAYTEALDAWQAGAGQDALKRRLEIAQREKNRFFANRIAQTELARAHQARVADEFMADVQTEVLEVRINPAHPRTDICFRAGTPITTARGDVSIETVRLGDSVLTHQGRWRRVTRVYCTPLVAGDRMLEIEVQVESGELLRAVLTPSHPVRVPSGWTRAGDLQKGCSVVVAPASSRCRPSDDDECDRESSGSVGSSTALGTCRDPELLRPSSSGYLVLSVAQTVCAETLLSAETCRACACQSSDSPRRRTNSVCCNSASHGPPEETASGTLGIGLFCIPESSTFEPGSRSRKRYCNDGRCSESCGKAYIQTGMLSSVSGVDSVGEDVFNLGVDEDNSYVAGGIVVHNCDMHARANLFGLGPGCYPKARAPRPPYHPFCWCRLTSRPDLTAKHAKEVPGGEAAYLRSLDPADAAAVMGSQDRARRVLDGASVRSVVDAGKDPAYRLVRVGDVAKSDLAGAQSAPAGNLRH